MSETSTVRYKQITRQARIQTREGEFSGGIFHTNKPLATGYSKLLVNYDVNATDGSLKTRRGFQTTAVLDMLEDNKAWMNHTDDEMFIIDSNVQNTPSYFGENKRTLNVVACAPNLEAAYIMQYVDPIVIDPDAIIDVTNQSGTKTFKRVLNYEYCPLSNGKGSDTNNFEPDLYRIKFSGIDRPNIHGQYCGGNAYADEDTVARVGYYLKKPVGTFAFGDKYFFFSNVQTPLKNAFAHLNLTDITCTITRRTVEDNVNPVYSTENIQYLCYDENTNSLRPAKMTVDEYENSTLHYADLTYATSWLGEGVTDMTVQIGISDGTGTHYLNFNKVKSPGLSIKELVKTYYMYHNTDPDRSDAWKFDLETRTDQALGMNVYIDYSSPVILDEYGAFDFIDYRFYGVRALHDIIPIVRTQDNIDDIELIIPPELHYIDSVPDVWNDVHTDPEALHTMGDSGGLRDSIIQPQAQNPSEAASAGYNMLLENPYDFVCESGANINILGILPYDTADTLVLSPVINKDLVLKCFYRAPLPDEEKKYHIKWEWREVGATLWNTAQDNLVDFTSLNLEPLTCQFRSAVEQLILRVTISDPDNVVTQADGTKIEYVESTTAIGLNFVTQLSASRQNVKPVKYDLGTAKGMLNWNSRLLLWGVKDAETMLFTSDVNNPTFFPYPNNVDVFEEPVLHCMLYGNDLVVFTTTRLYRLTFDESGITWTKTLVQKDLQITPQDIPMFCRVKNMLFFKSGNYYYMLVPKSSSVVGETTIAPITNNMKEFFDNFSKNVNHIFKVISQNQEGYTKEIQITDCLMTYYSYVNNQNVVLNFVYDLSQYLSNEEWLGGNNKYWVLSVIYDTENYLWKTYVYTTPRPLTPISLNAVQQTTFAYIIPHELSNYGGTLVQIEQTTEVADNFIIGAEYISGAVNEGPYKDYLSTPNLLAVEKNYQYLDTGYRLLNAVDLKKRFRELQFSVNNISQKALTFYTAFTLDGQLRRDMQGYNTKMLVNPDDPRTGILLVERPYIDPRYLPSVPEFTASLTNYINPSVTAGDTTLNESFVLDNTRFPELAYWKVRVSVSGKGYTPSLQLLSLNQQDYDLVSTNWIYRTMNSR